MSPYGIREIEISRISSNRLVKMASLGYHAELLSFFSTGFFKKSKSFWKKILPYFINVTFSGFLTVVWTTNP